MVDGPALSFWGAPIYSRGVVAQGGSDVVGDDLRGGTGFLAGFVDPVPELEVSGHNDGVTYVEAVADVFGGAAENSGAVVLCAASTHWPSLRSVTATVNLAYLTPLSVSAKSGVAVRFPRWRSDLGHRCTSW